MSFDVEIIEFFRYTKGMFKQNFTLIKLWIVKWYFIKYGSR